MSEIRTSTDGLLPIFRAYTTYKTLSGQDGAQSQWTDLLADHHHVLKQWNDFEEDGPTSATDAAEMAGKEAGMDEETRTTVYSALLSNAWLNLANQTITSRFEQSTNEARRSRGPGSGSSEWKRDHDCDSGDAADDEENKSARSRRSRRGGRRGGGRGGGALSGKFT